MKSRKNQVRTRRRKERANSARARRVGVLIVHGIGAQRYGKTVSEAMACFQSAVEQVGTFELKPASSDAGEIEAQIKIPGGPPFEVHAREAFWDDKVVAPTPGFVLRWCLLSLPIFLIQSALAWSVRYIDYHPIPDPKVTINPLRQVKDEGRLIGSIFPVLTAWLTAIALAPIAGVLLIIFSVSYVALRLFAKRSSWLSSIDRILTAYIGDVWVYVSESQEDKLVGFVSASIQQLSKEFHEVYVIAHSQGAEIARRAILMGPAPDGFIAVGSGENQLAFPRVARRNSWFLAIYWAMLLAYPIFFYRTTIVGWADLGLTMEFAVGYMAALLTGGQFPDLYLGQAMWPLIICIGTLTLGMAAVGRKFLKLPVDIGKEVECRTIVVRSPYDPVSLGQGLANQDSRSVALPRGANVFIEHVRYWDRPETGIAMLDMITKTYRRSSSSANMGAKTARWLVTIALFGISAATVFVIGDLVSPWWR